jgi:tetratricopeptide (TPR) repeat protein
MYQYLVGNSKEDALNHHPRMSESFSFIQLPRDAQLYILVLTDIQTVGRLAQTAQYYRNLTRDPCIYLRWICRDFMTRVIDKECAYSTFKELYRMVWLPLKKELRTFNVGNLTADIDLGHVARYGTDQLLRRLFAVIPTKEQRQNYIRKKNFAGYTPLHYAALNHFDILLQLLQEFPRDEWLPLLLDTTNAGDTALHLAAGAEKEEIVRSILSLTESQQQRIQLILQNGRSSGNALYHAVDCGSYRGNLGIIRYLLDELGVEHCLSAIIPAGASDTSIAAAIKRRDWDVIKLLLNEIPLYLYLHHLFEIVDTRPSLLCCAQWMNRDSIQKTMALLQRIPLQEMPSSEYIWDKFISLYEGYKFFQAAVTSAHIEAVTWCLDHIPRQALSRTILSRVRDGDTTLHIALHFKFEYVSRLLLNRLEHAGDSDFYLKINDQGLNLLQVAVLTDDIKLVELGLIYIPVNEVVVTLLHQDRLKRSTLQIATRLTDPAIFYLLFRQIPSDLRVLSSMQKGFFNLTLLHQAATANNTDYLASMFSNICQDYLPCLVCIKELFGKSVLQLMLETNWAEERVNILFNYMRSSLHHHSQFYELLHTLAMIYPVLASCLFKKFGKYSLLRETYFYALRKNDCNMIEESLDNMQLENNAIDVIEEGLLDVVKNGLYEAAQCLIKRTNGNIKDNVWQLAFHFASRKNDKLMVQLLLDCQKQEMTLIFFDKSLLSIRSIREVLDVRKECQQSEAKWSLLYHLSSMLAQQGHRKEAIAVLDDVIWLHPFFVKAIYDWGMLQYKQRQYQAVVTRVSDSIAIDPEYHSFYFIRGKALLKLGHYERAIADFDCAIKCSLPESMVYAKRGQCLLQLGFFDDAIINLSEHIRRAPDTTRSSYKYRGYANFCGGYYKEAIVDFSKYLYFRPSDMDIYCKKGIAKYFLGNYNAALRDLDYVASRIYNDEELYYYRGLIYYHMACYEEAMINCQMGILANTKSSQCYQLRAAIYLQMEDYKNAVDNYLSALSIDSNDAESHYRLARLKQRQLAPEGLAISDSHAIKAFQVYQQRVKNQLNFTNPENHYRLGSIFKHGIGTEKSLADAQFYYLHVYISKGCTIWHKKAEIKLSKLRINTPLVFS